MCSNMIAYAIGTRTACPQAAPQKQQALPVSGHTGEIHRPSARRSKWISSGRHPWPSVILFFLYLTALADFATIIRGYIYPDNHIKTYTDCCKPDELQQFFCAFFEITMQKRGIKMANRTRTHRNEFHLNDDEQYILNEKFRLSKMKSKSAFLRKLVLYGFVYDVGYSHIREMNAQLARSAATWTRLPSVWTPQIPSTEKIWKI